MRRLLAMFLILVMVITTLCACTETANQGKQNGYHTFVTLDKQVFSDYLESIDSELYEIVETQNSEEDGYFVIYKERNPD